MIRRTFMVAIGSSLAATAMATDHYLLPKEAPKKKTTVRVVKGMHSHLCRCGYEFWHFSGSHLCPSCRRYNTYVINRYA